MSKENQIDLINPNLGHGSMIAGYSSMEQLLGFVEASLNGGGNATLIVAMTMATCKNLIDEKLSDEIGKDFEPAMRAVATKAAFDRMVAHKEAQAAFARMAAHKEDGEDGEEV